MITAHPGLPEFDYIKPARLEDARRFLVEHAGEAAPFMGGTDTFVRMRDGVWKWKFLVDVKGLEGTTAIRYDPATGLEIGAAVSMNQVICSADVNQCYPLIAEAARSVASYQLRTRATIIGNICNASPAGDTTGACLVLGGVLQVYGQGGMRQERLDTFFTGPGKTVLKPGDIVTSIRFPNPPSGCEGLYIKLGRNAKGDLAIVGVTVLGFRDSSVPSGYTFKLALASVAPVPLVPKEAESILAQGPMGAECIKAAAEAAQRACSPIDDVRGSALYRRQMVHNLVRKGLTEIWTRLNAPSTGSN